MNLGKKIILGLLVIIVFHEAIAKGKQIDVDSTSVKFEWNFYEPVFTTHGMAPEVTNQIDEMAEFISKFPNDTFLVVGHTASCDGCDGLNETLLRVSRKKAKYIRQALIDRGVDPERIKFIGCEGKDPKVPNNKTLLDYEQNIRVTLEFYSPQRIKELEEKIWTSPQKIKKKGKKTKKK
ncbi:MAG: OmpA family protein [Paludibacteraceae bacterium]|nr:OmpA family protein [Paludibacteraceae bacterium]